MQRPIRQEAHLRVTAFACVPVPKASGSAIICSRVSSVAAPTVHSHELQSAHSPPKECSSPAWQIGQTR